MALPKLGDVVWLPLTVTHVHGSPDDDPKHLSVQGTLPDGQAVWTNAVFNAHPTEALAAAPTSEAVLALAGHPGRRPDMSTARTLPELLGLGR